MAEHLLGLTCAKHPAVVDRVGAGDHGLDDRHRLPAGEEVTVSVAEIDVLVEELLEPEVLEESCRQDEPGIGHRVVVVECHLQPVETVRRSHRESALRIKGCREFSDSDSP